MFKKKTSFFFFFFFKFNFVKKRQARKNGFKKKIQRISTEISETGSDF